MSAILGRQAGFAFMDEPEFPETALQEGSAILSVCEAYRYRLERNVAIPLELGADGVYEGKVVAFFGVNPSTADALRNDATVRKWIGFCQRWGVPRFLVGNVFAFRSTNVKALRHAADPFGPDNDLHIAQIIAEADILVPCWGDRGKLHRDTRPHLDALLARLHASGKPVMHFGLTNGGDPKHPQMLGYITPLTLWASASPHPPDEARGGA